MKEGEESNAIEQSKHIRKSGMEHLGDVRREMDPMAKLSVTKGMTQEAVSPGGEPDQPSLIQYRSKRRCVMEREKKKKKEWWEEENVLSDEDDFEDIDSDSSDNPKKKQKKKGMTPMNLLPPPPNRIFVFSTELANRAAEAVVQGRVPSIVAYHRAQPQNQNFLRSQSSNPSEYMMNHSSMGNINPYRYGNYPGRVSKMEGMFPGKPVGGMMEGQIPGRPGVAAGGLASGINSIHQYQQYLKQQQHEPRPAMSGVDELQQMLFGPVNGSSKGRLPPSTAEDQRGVRPPYGYSGHGHPGLRPQQMVINNQREERFKFPQQQSFITSQQQQSPQQQQQQHQQQQQQTQLQQQQPPQQSFSSSQPSGQQSHLTVLSPSSSASSSSPLGSNIRSPPPYPNPRSAETNTLPGASTSVRAPSPGNASSPQTPHAPLTPRLTTSLASPKDGQRPPFSPGSVPSSSNFSPQAPAQQNIRDSGVKHPLARQSPSLDKPELPSDKGMSSYGMIGDSRVNFTNTRQEVAQRPSSLDLSRNNHDSQALAPPNRSPFLPGSSPMAHHPNALGDSSAGHHSSKSFSVESLTAPLNKERFYRAPLTVQGASPYAAYSQQPGLFYAGNKFPPSMLGQGQYQFPAHIQSPPQQFFPTNIPPNMYLPRGSFPIHHAGNREGGM